MVNEDLKTPQWSDSRTWETSSSAAGLLARDSGGKGFLVAAGLSIPVEVVCSPLRLPCPAAAP